MRSEAVVVDNYLNHCGCGCGEVIPFISTRCRPQKWKKGHNRRGKIQPKPLSYDKILADGYYFIFAPEHVLANNKKYVRAHRLVWEDEHSACLLPWSIVHHKDDNRLNNVWYNLQAMMRKDHVRIHNPRLGTGKAQTILLTT